MARDSGLTLLLLPNLVSAEDINDKTGDKKKFPSLFVLVSASSKSVLSIL
jgi:hypothetical protein